MSSRVLTEWQGSSIVTPAIATGRHSPLFATFPGNRDVMFFQSRYVPLQLDACVLTLIPNATNIANGIPIKYAPSWFSLYVSRDGILVDFTHILKDYSARTWQNNLPIVPAPVNRTWTYTWRNPEYIYTYIHSAKQSTDCPRASEETIWTVSIFVGIFMAHEYYQQVIDICVILVLFLSRLVFHIRHAAWKLAEWDLNKQNTETNMHYFVVQ